MTCCLIKNSEFLFVWVLADWFMKHTAVGKSVCVCVCVCVCVRAHTHKGSVSFSYFHRKKKPASCSYFSDMYANECKTKKLCIASEIWFFLPPPLNIKQFLSPAQNDRDWFRVRQTVRDKVGGVRLSFRAVYETHRQVALCSATRTPHVTQSVTLQAF